MVTSVYGCIPDGYISVGLQPLHRSHPRLVGQSMVVADATPLQLLHDEADALLHLLLVRVTSLLHIGHGHTMCTEEDLDGILQRDYSLSVVHQWYW